MSSSVQAYPIVLDHDLKQALDTVVARVSNDVPASERAFLPPFVAALYHDVAAVDFATEPAGHHAHRVSGLWTFGRVRDAGAPQIRLYSPPSEGGYWRDEVTFIEIVNDDMPFLVDSISAELARLGIEVRLLLHPVFRVARDSSGAITTLAFKPQDGLFAESWMQITVSRQPEEKLELIKACLTKVLSDVRLAVSDWREMCQLMEKTKTALPSYARKDTPEADIKEAKSFIDWALDNHFVFLGVRHYEMAEGGEQFDVDHLNSRGVLRDANLVILKGIRRMDMLPEEVRSFLRGPDLLFVNKAQSRSTVHRPGHYDIIGIKQFDDQGRLKAITAFVGLFTSTAYSRNAEDIPWLCRKIDKVLELSGLDPKGHSGKALTHILNTYPRDDLFQITPEALFVIARGILSLTDRQRTALFVWKDPFRRFVSTLVYVPRDRFDTALRKRIIGILESAFAASAHGFYLAFSESPLVRLQVILDLSASSAPESVDLANLEKQIIQAARGWTDTLADLLVKQHGSEQGLRTAAFYSDSFPSAYMANETPEQAVDDLRTISTLLGSDMPLQVRLIQREGALHLRLFHKDSALPLSDVLPQLENMGLRIVSEQPYEISIKGNTSVWVHDFEGALKTTSPIDLEAREALFAEAVQHIYIGNMEDDSFNKLILTAGLNWREVTMLRAYGKYLQQARFNGTPAMVRATLTSYPDFARGLVELFHLQFNPSTQTANKAELIDEKTKLLEASLESVTSLAEDELLRRYLNLLQSSLRTNYYQTDAAGKPKSYLSIKLNSQKVIGLPAPRPWVEIWVYSPRVEGVHLRGGKVARGGLRWSDRRDDFRTEVLGLVKAQMVKNAVIVPVGSKGGFFCKKLVAGQPRATEQAEVVACYQTFIRGLLDLTDNMVQGAVVPPQNVVRLDQDDPYLVVAADKGTATFSDIANALSIDYGFWLGDAFASGGSVGYDHKAMGITARGAWESIKRHFRELDLDIQSEPFTCVGVGDMSGDVFGNGMLCSPFTKLVAAFNHKHIFIDPAPDVAISYAERKRLFTTPGTAWSDYKQEALSQGGAVYERSAKSITLSPEATEMLGLADSKITPNELIRTLLMAKVDLLYLGGIGTYIKASSETHADVSDKANDAVRVDAKDLRARVLGEGANLGSTAKARIEFARNGGHLNSDAVDNSAGVDTSDHEVNIKIALQGEVAKGALTMEARNTFLASMTDEVAHMVLQDNYLQTQMLSIEETHAPQMLDTHARLIRQLESTGLLNREVENLPSEGEIAARSVQMEGLTRPELAILMAYAKIALFNQIDSSSLPDEPSVAAELLNYFPSAMRESYAPAIQSHRLRREIIGTVLCNEIINRLGPAFVAGQAEQSGRSQADVARAYTVISSVFDLPAYWRAIESLDNKIAASLQLELLRTGQNFAKLATASLLANVRKDQIDTSALISTWQQALKPLLEQLASVLPEALLQDKRARALVWQNQGVPSDLALRAARLGPLSASPDILHIAQKASVDVAPAARAYYQMGARLGLNRVLNRLETYKAQNVWQQQESVALMSDLRATQIHLATDLLSKSQGDIAVWTTAHHETLSRYDRFVSELASAPQIDLAMVSLLSRSVSTL